MKMYLQVNESGYITDCITYAHPGYIEVEFNFPLPDHFIAGCYKYMGDNKIELDESKISAQEPDKFEKLEADILYLSIMTGVEL